MRKAFTLIEVNLAMLIMAGGILSIVALYTFGFRESKQSREDVESAALAEVVISQLEMAISATNLKWSAFRNEFNVPSDEGWGAYLDNNGRVSSEPNGDTHLRAAMSHFGGQVSQPAGFTLKYGVVVMHEQDSPIVRIGVRATKTRDQLLSMPLYYTEVRFQGEVDQ